MEQATPIEYHQAGRVQHKTTPSREWLRANYDYDVSRGVIVRRPKSETGCKSPYTTIQGKSRKVRRIVVIKAQKFKHSRIVWAWHHDDPKDLQIDHIDGDTLNDRIENLRLATNSQNNANKKGYRGYQKKGRGFEVNVMKNQKNHYGGYYSREEDAAKAASALRKALHGEFSDTRATKPSEMLRNKTVIQMPLF